VKNIPIIIPVFNQLTYLQNLINWWKWYYPENPIFIVDNRSTYAPLLEFYKDVKVEVHIYPENKFIPNMTDFIKRFINGKYEFYVISDPDIMPHPATPPNFLEIWKNYIETHKFHRVGFNLITKDLPLFLNEREMIIGNESELLRGKEAVAFGGFTGYKAPIDTTFCLYSTKNGGWSAPMNGKDWGNCLRLFEAFHLGWYIDGDHLNDEMKFYFETSKYRIPGQPSAGSNNNRPKQFQ
jgi:hypothetical protein